MQPIVSGKPFFINDVVIHSTHKYYFSTIAQTTLKATFIHKFRNKSILNKANNFLQFFIRVCCTILPSYRTGHNSRRDTKPKPFVESESADLWNFLVNILKFSVSVSFFINGNLRYCHIYTLGLGSHYNKSWMRGLNVLLIIGFFQPCGDIRSIFTVQYYKYISMCVYSGTYSAGTCKGVLKLVIHHTEGKQP